MKTYHLTNPLTKGGKDLIPLQQALKSHGYYNGKLDGIFGPSTANGCYKAKYALGYRKPNYAGGEVLLQYLTGKKKPTLAMQVLAKYRKRVHSKTQLTRQKIVSNALWGVSNNAQIHYAETRPMDELKLVRHLPWTSDCSEFATTIYCWAGAPDPNGLGYNGQGYTGTMLDNGKTVALHEAKAGDLAIFGPHPGHHVVVLVEPGTANEGNPNVVSHGQENDPVKTTLANEANYQPKPVTIKNYMKD